MINDKYIIKTDVSLTITYTDVYEVDFLEYLNNNLGWKIHNRFIYKKIVELEIFLNMMIILSRFTPNYALFSSVNVKKNKSKYDELLDCSLKKSHVSGSKDQKLRHVSSSKTHKTFLIKIR